LIAKSIKQSSVNVSDGIKEDAKQLNIEMALVLEKIDENEDIKKLKDISNKIWKEQNTQDKRNKHMLNILYHLQKNNAVMIHIQYFNTIFCYYISNVYCIKI
jgi:hypothetical protein